MNGTARESLLVAAASAGPELRREAGAVLAWAVLAPGLLFVSPTPADCQAVVDLRSARQEIAAEVRAGTGALSVADLDVAEDHFRRSLRISEKLGDEARAGLSYFYLGRTEQERADASRDSASAMGALERAVGHYRRALRLAPTSAAVHNNLGRAYERLGDLGRARKMYERALSIAGPDAELYFSNYANLLDREGIDPAGARTLRKWAERRPEDARTHRQLVGYYVRTGSGELVPYLWHVLEAGQVKRSEEAALRALREADVAASTREELLVVVAASLARQDYVPSELAETATWSALEELSANPALEPGIKALLAVHDGPDPGGAGEWWAKRGRPDEDPPYGMWPRDAFRELLRTLGRWNERHDRPDVAEEYFRRAARLAPGELDLVAVRDLARSYVRRGTLDRLEELVVEYEPELFAAKGDAYRARQVERIYEFHRTLGEIYAHLGQWGDRGTVSSAIFQLENALEKAELLDRSAPVDSIEATQAGVRFGPELAELLARAYDATGETAASRRTRLEAAERYQRLGAASAAVQMVEPIEVRQLEGAELQRYERLKISPAGADAPPDTAGAIRADPKHIERLLPRKVEP